MFPFAVLADDLTGACDSGAQFSARGARVGVLAAPDAPPPEAGAWDVVVLNTESRHLPPAEAAARVQAAAARLAGAGWPVRYKKIDSTLRGPLVAEAGPLCAEGAALLVCPAFPAAGRTVERGIVRVNGIPVHETEIGRDRHNPVPESHLPSLLAPLAAGSGAGVGQLTLHDQVRGPAHVTQRLAELLAAGTRIVSAEAVEDAHLDVLAGALLAARHAPGIIGVGSAGLARALAAHLLPQPRAAALPLGFPTPGPLLVVAGSRTAVTAAQVAHLAGQPDSARVPLELAPMDAPDWDDRARAWEDAVLDALARAAAGGATTLILQPAPEAAGGGDPDEAPERFAARSARLNATLGALVTRFAAGHALGGLVLTGGDIARAVLTALGTGVVQLGPEVLPGLPLGWPVDGDCPGLPLVTKAGGFGAPEALSAVVRMLREGRRA